MENGIREIEHYLCIKQNWEMRSFMKLKQNKECGENIHITEKRSFITWEYNTEIQTNIRIITLKQNKEKYLYHRNTELYNIEIEYGKMPVLYQSRLLFQ